MNLYQIFKVDTKLAKNEGYKRKSDNHQLWNFIESKKISTKQFIFSKKYYLIIHLQHRNSAIKALKKSKVIRSLYYCDDIEMEHNIQYLPSLYINIFILCDQTKLYRFSWGLGSKSGADLLRRIPEDSGSFSEGPMLRSSQGTINWGRDKTELVLHPSPHLLEKVLVCM